MLLRQIQFFVSIVDENSFTEAAEKNYVSQSAVSQAMNALEADLGVKLIERKNRSFQITTAGEYFYRKCKSLLVDLETIKKEAIRLGRDEEVALHVGYINLYAGPELSDAIAEFSALYPEVNISVQSGTHEELYHGLVSGSLDLALNDQRRAFSDDYVNMELKNAECIIELSERSELSSNERLEVADLAKMSCIIVSSKEQRETEAEYYRNILGFANDFLYAETQEEARLMVIGNRGFLPIEAVGKLPEVSGAIKRVPLYRKNRRVTRKYCIFWPEERTGYYIEEFARMLQARLI
ncbi:MAG: LysR family transcriptional regulator [Lachnospiraceae bacterium]|nr:LysR family transcriptional regulator [Lachnospiraceae bacterium]